MPRRVGVGPYPWDCLRGTLFNEILPTRWQLVHFCHVDKNDRLDQYVVYVRCKCRRATCICPGAVETARHGALFRLLAAPSDASTNGCSTLNLFQMRVLQPLVDASLGAWSWSWSWSWSFLRWSWFLGHGARERAGLHIVRNISGMRPRAVPR